MIATIIISIILLAIVAAVIAHMVKLRKSGKGSCGCDCSQCGGVCHMHDEE